MPRDFGFSGLGLSLRMTPFSTTAITEHLLTHISQVVGISRRSAALAGEWLKGFMYANEAVTAAVAAPPAENVRNFRRFMPCLSLPGCLTGAYGVTVEQLWRDTQAARFHSSISRRFPVAVNRQRD